MKSLKNLDELLSNISRWMDDDELIQIKKDWNSLNTEEKKEILIKAWLYRGPNERFHYDWWIPLFTETGFLSNIAARKPLEDIRLYRGSKPKYKSGMSWSSDIKVAKIFAALEKNNRIYTTVVKPEWVLGILSCAVIPFRGQNEEYVVNYRKLSEDSIEEFSL